ncbi:carbon-nitrogen hydrolase family protein [Candidatus Methanomassiliicoccus intestinalis]|uniref:carbon-nitrogen hydrolase family protein n=1 Tax=Candidatus Methanomassiliicoccus intestinalis TaxID=1406512 RepID=UPI0037DD32D4
MDAYQRSENINLAVAQLPCTLGNKAENIGKMKHVLENQVADLYIFPELFLTGYLLRDEIFRLSETLDGPSFQAITALAKQHQANILFGAPVLEETAGLIKNSALIAYADGSIDKYDKIHPANFGPFEEGLYFAPGEDLKIIEVNGYRFGLLICYDLFFSELSRSYALQGVDGLICLSASPITSRSSFETVLPARAVENALYVVYANQVGSQSNQLFFGGSEVRDPSGTALVKNAYFNSEVASASLSKSKLANARRMRPTVRDFFSL